MASVLYQSIETLSRDKGIEPGDRRGRGGGCHRAGDAQVLQDAGEHARARWIARRARFAPTSSRRSSRRRSSVEDEINQMTLEQARELAPEVEVGGELRFYKDTTPLGRIAAQMAKQVIFQKVREAERDTVFLEYNHRAGEVLTATVKRLEPMDVIFDLGKAEARMPKREQSRLEQFCRRRAGSRGAAAGGSRGEGSAGDCVAVPRRRWCRTCSRARFRRSTTARFRFARLRARPASGRRSR